MDGSIRYVLYTHLAYQEKEDFNKSPTESLSIIDHLRTHLPQLRKLLTTHHYEGVLVIFYAWGFEKCLDGMAERKSKADLLAIPELAFADTVAQTVEQEILTDGELRQRIRFVTALDLIDIFGRMNWTDASRLKWWFIGSEKGIRYDTPKIIEAIMRLRLLGTNVPVFRIDHDVLFQGKPNCQLDCLGVFRPIASALQTYARQRDEPSVATFLFSASYDSSPLLAPKPGFEAWSRAFATRVVPALPVVVEKIEKVEKGEWTWDNYCDDVFDESLARSFYGLQPTGLESAGVSGIGRIGAHPLVSVISGALLCLSDGAILDLPPFSNLALNVSWIDDHLKYSLHRELGHFTTGGRRMRLNASKLDRVMLTKGRPPISGLPSYVLTSYLPTMLWGTIMDAWITAKPLLKYRPEELSVRDRRMWFSLRAQKTEGILPNALQTALEKRALERGDKNQLRIDLNQRAVERINEVRKEWKNLTNDRYETFASIWAKGLGAKYFPNIDAIGVGLTRDGRDVKNIDPGYDALLEGTMDYIEWTLYWPGIVQVVRSVEPGTLRSDLTWQP